MRLQDAFLKKKSTVYRRNSGERRFLFARRTFRAALLERLRAVTATAEEFAAEAREILGVEVA